MTSRKGGLKHSDLFVFINYLNNQNRLLAAIQTVGNNTFLTREFTVSQTTDALILTIGEYIANELLDFGWLTTEDTNHVMWKMNPVETKHAGGDLRNRIQVSTISLKPGKYHLMYRSDSLHSYGAWIGFEPDHAQLWGIAAYSLLKSEKENIRKILEKDYYKINLGDEGQLVFIYEDLSGTLWAIMRGGELCRFDLVSKQFIPLNFDTDELLNYSFSTVFEDRSANLWLGTENNGLIKRMNVRDWKASDKSNRFIQYKKERGNPNSISSNTIFTIFQDKRENLWIGTDLGLNKFNQETETFVNYREKHGLPSDVVIAILEDEWGNLWLSTKRGLARFDPVNETFKNFDPSDGLQGYEFTQHACYKSRDGQMFFGGINGFNAFFPDQVMENTYIPPVVFTDFQIFNKAIQPGKNGTLKSSIFMTNEIQLTHKQSVFSFEFAALDYTVPEKNQYAYKMEGVNADWVYTDASRRFATYTNLDPGRYIFRVKASNHDGVWNKKNAILRIIITPPFWHTTWFRLFLIFTISVLIYLVYRYRVNHLLELERMRIQIASDLHDDIGSTLTKIAIHSEIIQTTEEKSQVTGSSRKIGEMSREIITTLSDIVWSIDARNDTVGDLIDRMRDFLDGAFAPGSINREFQVQGLVLKQKIKQNFRQNMYLIFKEAVNNVVKHSRATKIGIYLTNEEGKFCLEVIDNGIGLATHSHRSGHFGLANMKLRAERISGNLRIESGRGTRIILTTKNI